MTLVKKLRKTSSGIQGTFANADHHAKRLLPLVKQLGAAAKDWGFAEWKQGHNVHIFTSDDGRSFVMRPWRDETNEYAGIQVFARISRSTEIPLFVINAPSLCWPCNGALSDKRMEMLNVFFKMLSKANKKNESAPEDRSDS